MNRLSFCLRSFVLVCVRVFALTVFLQASFGSVAAHSKSQHVIHFENTDHELHVYKIKGEQPGKTMLIIGGMHNEPGGYVTADLFADTRLKKGNLIVVPRANMPAIVNNKRGINNDMNRTFVDKSAQHHQHIYEDDIVSILKSLIAKSDVLLNLHDGYGFYRPEWESELANPKRWGQAIITDRNQFKSNKNDKMLMLGKRAQSVVDKVNLLVQNPDHRFHYKNTRTKDQDSIHKEQRRSATFYALYEQGIESYGIETSKNIRSLDLKVTYQTMIVNAFLEEFDIIVERHSQQLAKPKLAYLLVSVNNQRPVAYKDGEVIHVEVGDTLRIDEALTNYERGVMVDLEQNSSLNDIGKTFRVTQSTAIRVLKDQYLAGRVLVQTGVKIGVQTSGQTASLLKGNGKAPVQLNVAHLVVELNGLPQTIKPGETLSINDTDTLKLIRYQDNHQQRRPSQINFIGFVGNRRINDGEDRGYLITKNQLIKRFSIDGNGKVYRIKAEQGQQLLAQFYVNTDG
ncbi:MAG: succinylglutamate desuccinylase/aspartoacylase family protein [Algicola sp.]|nr:succinylglutamate desuccinylase/aspartoacylase family protein [Algicola sp.]